MPMINMIAARRAERKRLEKNIRILVFSVLGVIVLGVALFTTLEIRNMQLQGDLNDVNVAESQIRPSLDEVERLKTAKSQLEPKVTLLGQAQSGTYYWKDFMLELTKSIPQKTWLTGVTVTKDDKGGNPVISLSGVSTRQALIGETMLLVGDHKDIKDVKLRSTSLGKTNKKTTVISFELAAEATGMENKPK